MADAIPAMSDSKVKTKEELNKDKKKQVEVPLEPPKAGVKKTLPDGTVVEHF